MSGAPRQPSYDVDRVKRALPPIEEMIGERVALKRQGNSWVALCPFHTEKTPSFTVDPGRQRFHCFGCGASGDVLDFWQGWFEVDFKTALGQLAGVAGVGPSAPLPEGRQKAEGRRLKAKASKNEVVRPDLPGLRALDDAELAGLASLRGLSVEGVRVAASVMGRVFACEWPQWKAKRGGAWRVGEEAQASWVVTDESRWVAQFRRLDGEPYTLRYPKDPDRADREIKCWTKGSPTWPIGAAELGRRRKVLLVEGGADLLATYHFLWGFGLLEEVAVVCMLGSANRIRKEALSFFEGCRVRVLMDADEPKAADGSGGITEETEGEGSSGGCVLPPAGVKLPGVEAAARWQDQLSVAGAAVESFSFYGLETAAGKRVKDVNDLALCSSEVVGSAEVSDAFFAWDF